MPALVILASALWVPCQDLRVHDGDSIRCGQERVRIENIDATELPDSPKYEGYRRRMLP